MPARHAKPYCWGRLKYTQDEIHNMHHEVICPHCKCPITNADVTDPFQLVDFISLIKAAGSKIKLF